MRKILYMLLLLVAFTTTALSQNYTPFQPVYKSEKADFNLVPATFIYHFSYEGQRYIKFNGQRGSGIVYDLNGPYFKALEQRQDTIILLLTELRTANKNQYLQSIQENKILKQLTLQVQALQARLDSLEAKQQQ